MYLFLSWNETLHRSTILFVNNQPFTQFNIIKSMGKNKFYYIPLKQGENCTSKHDQTSVRVG